MAETEGSLQDLNILIPTCGSEEIDGKSISMNTVKKVRFSEYIDYCVYDPFENDISTTSETEINCEISELTEDVISLDISSSVKMASKIEDDLAEIGDTVAVNNDLTPTYIGNCNELLFLQEKNFSCPFSQKRISKLVSQKQTKRLNDLLKKNPNELRAKDYKAVVFKAWTNVKRGIKENHSSSVPSKSDSDSLEKSNIAFINWKNSKAKKLKCSKKRSEKKSHSRNFQNQEKNKEENEMVFLSWKKRKDEILKQEALNRKKEERNAAEMELMNKEEKQRDGKCAFQAWKAQKDQNKREEKKKLLFYKEREKEAFKEKESRSLEAQHMYELWIEYKFSIQSKKKESCFNTSIPWYPPGN